VCGPQECCCEKRCEIQSGGQEMAVMVGLKQNFNNDNSGEYVLVSLQFGTQIHLNYRY